MIQTMIFDLDGTLVRTEALKALSYARAAAVLRPNIHVASVEEAFKQVVGLPRRQVASALMKRFELEAAAAHRMAEFGVDTPWQAFVQIRLQFYQRMLADPALIRANQWPHNMELLRQARRSCEHVALATMSGCRHVQRVLQILAFEEAFDFVATRDDVEQGKPDPEIYLLVAAELDVKPTACLVVEDSPAGVAAALAAGMEVIAVATPFTRDRLHQSELLPASRIVDEPTRLPAAVAAIVEELETADTQV